MIGYTATYMSPLRGDSGHEGEGNPSFSRLSIGVNPIPGSHVASLGSKPPSLVSNSNVTVHTVSSESTVSLSIQAHLLPQTGLAVKANINSSLSDPDMLSSLWAIQVA